MPDPTHGKPDAPASPMVTAGDGGQPAWFLINVATFAICDRRWGEWHREDGPLVEWLAAKKGDVEATRDDMATALWALHQRGLVRLDWEAEPPASRPVPTPSEGPE